MSRVWRKVKADWGAWNVCSLAEEPIVRLILDGTVVRVRLDRKATSNHCFSSSESWRAVLDDLVDRGLPCATCMKNVSANVGEIPPESIQGQLGTYVGEDDILRLVEFV